MADKIPASPTNSSGTAEQKAYYMKNPNTPQAQKAKKMAVVEARLRAKSNKAEAAADYKKSGGDWKKSAGHMAFLKELAARNAKNGYGK